MCGGGGWLVAALHVVGGCVWWWWWWWCCVWWPLHLPPFGSCGCGRDGCEPLHLAFEQGRGGGVAEVGGGVGCVVTVGIVFMVVVVVVVRCCDSG